MAAFGLPKSRKLLARKRLQKQRSARRILMESLEARQLLAVGPQLLSIQPNSGDLLADGDVLHVSPRELTFRFDDTAGIDPNTLDGIRVVRSGDDGVFERASRASDLGSAGQTLVEFYAQEVGQAGNGIEIRFTQNSRTDTRAPIIRVDGRTIDVEMNTNPSMETRVEDLLQAFDRDIDTPATRLVYALRLRGSQTLEVGQTVDTTQPLVLTGANAAKVSTDFGLGNNLEVRLVARAGGAESLGTTVNVTSRDFGGAGSPIVTVSGKVINVELNSNPRYASTVNDFVNAINSASSPASTLIEAQLVSGVGVTRIGNAPTTYSPLVLTGVTDIEILPAYVGLGDSDREVIMRFAEPLPDDEYRVEILGQGIRALTNVNGEAFDCGISKSVAFELDLGAQVSAVVPQPVSRDSNGQVSGWTRTSEIDVYLNDDQMIDLMAVQSVNGLTLSQLTAERGTLYFQNSDTIVFSTGTGQRGVLDPRFYQLHSPQGSLRTSDDPAPELPTRVRYYPEANRVSLRFSKSLDEFAPAGGELRLRVGTNENAQLAPVDVDALTTDPEDTFAAARPLSADWTPGAGGTQSVIINSEIRNTTPFLLDFPGGSDEPGNRQIRMQDNLRLGADVVDGTSVVFYNFQGHLGVLNGSTLLNAITETQKERVREVMSLYEEYLGIRFVESQNLGLTIGVGDMRAIVPFPDVVGGTSPGIAENNQPGLTVYEAGTLISNGQAATVLDIQDFSSADQNNFAGPFMRAAMQAVGKLIGLGDADELEQMTIQSVNSVFAPGVGTEIVLPGDADIVHGQYLYRPDSKDIDLYQFTLPVAGKISIEAFAERMSEASLLDSTIRLYEQTGSGWSEIASNDDYYSSDSFLSLELGQGNYIVGVSASGNSDYDPSVADSGIGGRSEGRYQLRMDFRPPANAVLRDADSAAGTEFDGDADGTPGGVFNFWFRPSSEATTKFVDKSAPAGGDGSIASPYKYIDDAIDAATAGDVVRILGNAGADNLFGTQADNLAYEIGTNNLGQALPDGATFDVPKDVSVMIDAGAILKLRRARIGVGSTSTNVDNSSSSLLVLGTPSLQTDAGQVLMDASGNALSGEVYFTSINDAEIGKPANPNVVGITPAAGDWGGIDFRTRVDTSDPNRENLEREGIFLNWVSHADIRYGGGQVVVDGLSQAISPIQMIDARPTIVNSSISASADAAMSATPNSFLESNFHSPQEQNGFSFTVDYDRVGPELYGNSLVGNSINALQVRTRLPGQEESLTVSGRFDDAGVVHYISENLQIAGTPGGALQSVAAPATTRTIVADGGSGSLAGGTYNYRFTTVDSMGLEGPASSPTADIFVSDNGAIRLSNLENDVRRIYRSAAGGEGPYTLVGEIAASVGSFTDRGGDLGTTLDEDLPAVSARLNPRLQIDPGLIVKLQGSRIDVGLGAQLLAEGTDGNSVVFTSLNDTRYGAGGTFDTANREGTQVAVPGDWGGINLRHTSSASLDHTTIAYGGGTTRVAGGFSDFTALEVHQADLRLTNSRIERNADGASTATDPERGGLGENSPATIFVRAAQPIIVGNIISDNAGPAISANVSALNHYEVEDYGRSTGRSDRYEAGVGNRGPLVAENRLNNNLLNGLQVRGGTLTTEGWWDDTDIVHIVQEEIVVPDYHAFGGLRLASSSNQSLVVKLEGTEAGFTATGNPLDNADRIGGAVQLIGQPGLPVILTSLNDSSVGAGFTLDGNVQADTNNSGGSSVAAPGEWGSVEFATYSNDRNVMLQREMESPLSNAPRANETPQDSQYLGVLATNEKSGDENRRLGFHIQGSIAAPSDVDVYTFTAEGGTEVWLDIDRTTHSLDTIVELVDANGATLALSDNSYDEEANPNLLVTSGDIPRETVNPLRASPEELYYTSALNEPKDLFSTNPKDAGFRVSLPGQDGASNLYHVRVRSADSLTHGNYQLQIRLGEIDEVPGSSVNYADIRFAQSGVRLVGVPGNSPLLGENSEFDDAGNNAFAGAQPLGNLLETNRQALSVAGEIDSTTDVDWFSFDIDYQRIRPSSIREYFATVFDIDYANGIGRPDTSLYVFDSAGNLILGGLGSNLVDDQASPLNAADNSDLSRGSAGSLDPFIGSYELPSGQYFLAVTNSSRIPAVIAQFNDPNTGTPLVRLQPIEGVQLIAEDHVSYNGGSTAQGPIVPDLFVGNEAVVDYGLGDIVLYVSRDTGQTFDSARTQLYSVNPFTGEQAVFYANQDFDVQDIALRDNGELRAFDRAVLGGQGGDIDNLIDYINIDTGTGNFAVTGASGLQTFHREFDTATPPNPTAVDSNDGVHPEAITFGDVAGQERGFFVGSRPTPAGVEPSFFGPPQSLPNVGSTRPGPTYFSNLLFEFDENTGAAISGAQGDKAGALAALGAGTAVRERGYIETRDLSGTQPTLLVAREATGSNAGQPTLILSDGDQFTLVDRTTGLPLDLDFEFDFGPEALINYDPQAGRRIDDGMTFTIDGIGYEFDTGSVIVIDAVNGSQLDDGATVTVTNAGGTAVTFEFDSDGVLSNPGNTAVAFQTGLSQAAIANALATAINLESGFGVSADIVPGSARIALTGASSTVDVASSGNGISIDGTVGLNDAANVRIGMSQAASERQLVGAIAAAMPGGVTVGYELGRINFSGAVDADFGDLASSGIFVDQGSSGAVNAGNIAVRVLASDTADTIAARIAQAINDLGIVGLTASTTGREIQLFGATVRTTGPLTAGGSAPGGLVTGIATIGNQLYAVSDEGGLYSVNNPHFVNTGNIATYVSTSYDLIGIEFSGLVTGPADTSLTGGVRVLFGIDTDGVIHAFDTAGRLQPVFANGATSVDTGLRGANGVAFSTLQSNPWGMTSTNDNTNRENDPGHGQPATPNGSSLTSRNGGTSYYFGDSGAVNYNFVGGAAGAIESVPFSLAGIGEADLPILYFNYFLETAGVNGNRMQDAFRVYASGEDGNWQLLATNNSATNQELLIDRDVQELFDNTGGWRQARVPLDRLAGLENVKLRIEFSTGGGFGYNRAGGRGPEIRTISGDRLADGMTLVINNEEFEIEMGPTLSLPSGNALSDGDSITIDGTRFVFTDGSGPAVVAPDIAVAFQSTDSSEEVALALQAAIAGATLNVPMVTGIALTHESNDIIARSEASGISGGRVHITHAGNIGDNLDLADLAEDVDLVRFQVDAGSTINVSTNAATIGSGLDTYLRVFDADGNQIASNDNSFGSTDSELSFTSPDGGLYYIGVSSAGNAGYNPTLGDNTVAGTTTGNYELQVEISRPLVATAAGNRLQLSGAGNVLVQPGTPVLLQGNDGTNGVPIRVTAEMTALEVAEALQKSVADYFAGGQQSAYAIRGGDTIDLTGLSVESAGPFGLTTTFEGEQVSNAFNRPERAQNNNFEGVYVDDFIIGIAGRGEMAVGPTGGDTNFVANPDATNQILTGPYQLEVRGGQEYGVPTTGRFIITDSFQPTDRLAPGISIDFNSAAVMIAGDTFTVSDGPNVLTFEMDDVNDGRSVAPGNIALPFNNSVIDPQTGSSTSESAQIIAARFRDLLNSPGIQSQINVAANLLNNDRIGATSSTVVLIGDAAVEIPPSIGDKIVSDGDGARNRERPQGQIVISNSRITNSAGFGATIEAAPRDATTGAAVPGSPRNTVTLNDERLAPGAVIMNSEFLFNGLGGISVTGDSAAANLPAAAVPFVRLVNNSVVGGSVTTETDFTPEVYENIAFSLGSVAFADSVESYVPTFGGGPVPAAGLDDPSAALGTPDFAGTGEPAAGEGAVSLGRGGQVTLVFQDNLLTGSGDDAPDLMIFEVGDTEDVEVEVSQDGVLFTSVGRASGTAGSIDLDAFGFGLSSRLAYVRLTDLASQGSQSGDSVGADIDAVGAISSVPADAFTAGGDGIVISTNATATILNNVVINSENGINVDASSSSTVVGGTLFQHNNSNVAGVASTGQFPTFVDPSTPVFTSVSEGNLYPVATSPLIDSSVDSLLDRPSLVVVKAPLGIGESPILAPQFDINGQLRVDDPAVETPAGLGDNVFKDRGAQDRADALGPAVVLINPVDNDLNGVDGNPTASIVELTNATLKHFDVRLFDGQAPGEPSPGAGIDHSTVNSSSVLLYRNNVPLVEGIHYNFGYDSTNGIIRLTPLTGVWPSESVYTIRFVNANESSIAAKPAASYTDGESFDIVDASGGRTTFEFDLGIRVTVPSANGSDADVSDGDTFIVDDGSQQVVFEFDNDGSVSDSNTAVPIGGTPTPQSVGRAIETAIESSSLSITVVELAAGQLQLDGSRLAQFLPQTSGLIATGSPGVRTGFGIQIPLSEGNPSGLTDGQTFTISRGGSTATFELDTNGVTSPGNNAVRYLEGDNADEIGESLVSAINAAALGLTPTYAGGGLVTLGGDSDTRLDMSSTVLSQSGLAGQGGAVPIKLSGSADVTADQVAEAIEAAIDAQNLPGISSSQFGPTVIVEGALGVAGQSTGAVSAIKDKAGNPLRANRDDGSTEISIFMGEGLDYGDAPAPYASTASANGPRHTVVDGLSIGATVTPDADAKLNDIDQDDGLTFTTAVVAGFEATAEIDVTNTTGSDAYLTFWVDFNGDGVFTQSEKLLDAALVASATTVVSFDVPSNAAPGTVYSRVRLATDPSEIATATGLASDGEVEDHAIALQSNPFQNQSNNLDVNGDSFVSPIDVLQVINYLNSGAPTELTLPATDVPPYLDVNGDGFVAPLDALIIINYLNAIPPAGEGEGMFAPTDVLGSDWAPGLESLRSRREPAPQSSTDLAILQSTDDDSDALAGDVHASQSADMQDMVWSELDLGSDPDDEEADDDMLDSLVGDLS